MKHVFVLQSKSDHWTEVYASFEAGLKGFEKAVRLYRRTIIRERYNITERVEDEKAFFYSVAIDGGPGEECITLKKIKIQK